MEKVKKWIGGFIGTKAFYSSVLVILIPLIVQQGITNFVNLLDNLMVGRLNTEAISSVAIVNQIVFVFNLTIFGGVAGVSIFGAQFYGKGDEKGLRYSFRMKIWMAAAICIVGVVMFLFWGDSLISSFLHAQENDTGDPQLTFDLAKKFMRITILGLPPFALSQVFGSTLKDTGETIAPMKASFIAITANFVLDYIMIYGKFGFPALGVAGDAIATVIARYLELFYIVWFTYSRKKKFTFIIGAFRSLKVPLPLATKVLRTASPLLLNEFFWSFGTTMINRCYSMRGLDAVTSVNINTTVWSVFAIVMMAMGNAIGIITGQKLGANDIEGAKDTAKKLLCIDILLNTAIGILIILAAPLVPKIYNTSAEIQSMAATLLVVSGIVLPLDAYANGTYFVLRSGGKTVITFLFDCVFTWVVALPIAILLTQFTDLPLNWIYLFVQSVNFIKVIIGTILIRSGIWAKNVVGGDSQELQPDIAG